MPGPCALAYAEVATLIPTAGGAYTYTYVAIGERLAWIVGWSLILEYSLACSTVAVGWPAYLVGWLHSAGIQMPSALLSGPHGGGIVNLPAVLVASDITGMLIVGTRQSATFNIVLVVIKLTALACFVALALPAFNSANLEPLAFVLRTLNHPFAAWAIGLAALIALPSVILVMMYGQSRIFFVVARDGLLPKRLSAVSACTGTPILITAVTGIFVAFAAGLFRLDEIAELANAGTLLAFVTTAASMMMRRRRRHECFAARRRTWSGRWRFLAACICS